MTSVGGSQPRVLLFALVFAILLLALYFPLSPALSTNPGRDSGGFLYTGQQILEGRLLYRDIWEHKPPLIFYINALGIALGGGTWWGLWLLELVFAAATYALLFRALQHDFRSLPGFVGCLAALIGWLSLAQNFGNYAEEYALLFQVAALLVYVRRDVSEFRKVDFLVFSLAAAMAFLLKPTLMGVWVAIAVAAFLRDATLRTTGRIAMLAVLSFAIIGLTLVPFAAAGAWHDLYDQVVVYNSGYSAATLGMRLGAAWKGVGTLLVGGAGIVAILYWPIVWLDPRSMVRGSRLIAVAALDLPLEIVFASATGRPYRHYFFSLLPAIAILTAAGLRHFSMWWATSSRRGSSATALLTIGTLIVIRGITWMSPSRQERVMSADAIVLGRDRATAIVKAAVPAGETVLVWGAEPSVNFLARRASPTRYAYQYPLLQHGYSNASRIDEFVEALRRSPPAAVIDTSSTNPIVLPLDSRLWPAWKPTPPYVPPREIERVVAWVHDHYDPVITLAQSGWTIYRRRPDAMSPAER